MTRILNVLVVFTIILLYSCSKSGNNGHITVPELNSYSKVISNIDFAGSLDTSKWVFVPDKFWNYNETQTFLPDNSKNENGFFQIQVDQVKQEDSVKYYSSSRKIEVPENTGRIDIRVNFPTEKGILSALSLRNRNEKYPDYSGIDIAAIRGLGDMKYGVSSVSRFQGHDGLERGFGDGFISSDKYEGEFHLVSLVKEQDAIFCYFNNKLVYKCYKQSLIPHDFPFNNPMDLYINVSVDGYWAGPVDVRTKFPQTLEVDYVKFYEELGINPNDNLDPLPEFSEYTELEWAVDFNQNEINTDNWNFALGDYWWNSEKQAYTDDTSNVFIRDNNLVLKAIESPAHIETFREYTSARLNTRNKKDFHFGRLDVRAKLPKSQGIWPAIWMMSTEEKYGFWPFSGEIDIMEQHGHELDMYYTSVHCSGNDSIEVHKKKTDFVKVPWASLNDEFHLYSLALEKDRICWYLDEELVMTFGKRDMIDARYPFNEKFYLILNIAVGGGWPGYPDETTVFPQEMVVDYVRYYTSEEYSFNP